MHFNKVNQKQDEEGIKDIVTSFILKKAKQQETKWLLTNHLYDTGHCIHRRYQICQTGLYMNNRKAGIYRMGMPH